MPLQQVGNLSLQDRVGLQPDRVPVTLSLQQLHQLRGGKRGIAPEELGDRQVAVAREHRQEHPPPELGAVVVAAPQLGRSRSPNWLKRNRGWWQVQPEWPL